MFTHFTFLASWTGHYNGILCLGFRIRGSLNPLESTLLILLAGPFSAILCDCYSLPLLGFLLLVFLCLNFDYIYIFLSRFLLFLFFLLLLFLNSWFDFYSESFVLFFVLFFSSSLLFSSSHPSNSFFYFFHLRYFFLSSSSPSSSSFSSLSTFFLPLRFYLLFILIFSDIHLHVRPCWCRVSNLQLL